MFGEGRGSGMGGRGSVGGEVVVVGRVVGGSVGGEMVVKWGDELGMT